MLIAFVLTIPDNDFRALLAYLQDVDVLLFTDWIKLNHKKAMAHKPPRHLIYIYF
jgi:hypothetical protein